MNKLYTGIGAILFGTLFVGCVMVIVRFLGVALAWLSGKIIEWIFGAYIASGVNAIIPGEHFTAGLIPVASIVLYVVGSFLFQHGNERKADGKKED